MATESELLHTWRSAPNRANILVLAPATALYLPYLMELRDTDNCEVVHLEKAEAAVRLLRRGSIAVLVVDGQMAEPGALELITEALHKEDKPRVLVLSQHGSVRGAVDKRQIRRVRIPMDREVLQKLVLSCAEEFKSRPLAVGVAEILEAAQEMPDQGWLHVTGPGGRSGDLCVRAGKAIYAEAGDQAGLPASQLILQWRECEFEWRELPAYLQGNLDISIGDLIGGPVGKTPAAPAPAPASSTDVFLMPGVATRYPDPPIAEPAEFSPEFSPEFSMEPEPFAPTDGLLDLPGEMDWARTLAPADALDPMPEPDLYGEWGVEEPTDFSLDFTVDEGRTPPPPVTLAAIPPLPATRSAAPSHAVASVLPPQAPPPAPPPARVQVRSSIFLATAVLPEFGNRLESCLPVSEAGTFDVDWLRNQYREMARYMHNKGLGELTELTLLTPTGGLVLAPLQGEERLLVVRLSSGTFGADEREELKRLREVVLSTSLLAAR